MSDRFTQRGRKQRRSRLLKWVLWIGGLAIVVGAGWLVWFSSVLSVQHVAVAGNDLVTDAQVRRAANFDPTTPLIRVDLDAARARVERLKPVESAKVSRSWPRSVRIVITERTDVGWIAQPGGPWAVDRHGVVFRSLGATPTNLPQLQAEPGSALKAAAQVAAELGRDTDLLASVRTISAASRASVTLTLDGNRQVVWGTPGNADAKIHVLKTLLRSVRASYYDVSAPSRPTTRQ